MSSLNGSKDLGGCSTCSKSRLANGVTLRKCAGCGAVHYCCKDCQMADWPQHRGWCKARQAALATLATTPGAVEIVADREARARWLNLHLISLQQLAFQDLAASGALALAAHVFFRVRVRARRGERDPRRAFELVGAAPQPVPRTGHNAARVREAYASAHAVNARAGGGTFVLGVVDEELAERIPHVLAIGYNAGTVRFVYRTREELIAMVNRGEVLKASHMRSGRVRR